MDIKNMPTSEISRVITDLQAELQKRMKAERADFLKEIKQRAKLLGIPVASLLADAQAEQKGTKGVKKKTTKKKRVMAKVAPKYRNPHNAQETWTGRGKKPKWIEAHLATGGTLQDILI